MINLNQNIDPSKVDNFFGSLNPFNYVGRPSRTPGLASLSDAGRNLYGAYSAGFDLSPKNMFRAGSVGGLATFGGLAAAGAGAGALLGSQMEGAPVGQAALVGAGIGLAALPLAGVAGRAGLAIGKGALNLAAKGVDALPGAAMNVAGGIGNMITPFASRYAGAIGGFAQSLVRWDIPTETLTKQHGQTLLGKMTNTSGIKFTGPISGAVQGWNSSQNILGRTGNALRGAIINGKTVLAAGAAISGAAGAFHEMNKIRMGTMDNQITRATPRVPSFSDNAGATGDLVFALNANRRG